MRHYKKCKLRNLMDEQVIKLALDNHYFIFGSYVYKKMILGEKNNDIDVGLPKHDFDYFTDILKAKMVNGEVIHKYNYNHISFQHPSCKVDLLNKNAMFALLENAPTAFQLVYTKDGFVSLSKYSVNQLIFLNKRKEYILSDSCTNKWYSDRLRDWNQVYYFPYHKYIFSKILLFQK